MTTTPPSTSTDSTASSDDHPAIDFVTTERLTIAYRMLSALVEAESLPADDQLEIEQATAAVLRVLQSYEVDHVPGIEDDPDVDAA